MKKTILAVVTAMMFLGCESPVEEKTNSVYTEKYTEWDSIGLERRDYTHVAVIACNEYVRYYSIGKYSAKDTAWIEVPAGCDTIDLVTENSSGLWHNLVPVVADSIYVLRAK